MTTCKTGHVTQSEAMRHGLCCAPWLMYIESRFYLSRELLVWRTQLGTTIVSVHVDNAHDTLFD